MRGHGHAGDRRLWVLGVVHNTSLVDLSLDLPLVLEFFDLPERAERAIEGIADFVAPGHMVSWPVMIEGDGKPC